MKIFIRTILLLCFISNLFAQTVPPVLISDIEGKTEALLLSKVDVDVKIFGVIAETKMTLTFFNNHNRQLSGDFYFPLPEGATVSGYALDINGVMVDGAVVEKQKGRVVFEKIVRKGIDPGLVEWVKGNNFKTRVFPIPAKGARTISVRYLSELVYKNQNTFFHLPLNFNKKIKNLSLKVEVIKAISKPEIKKGGPENFRFSQWRDSYVADTELKDILLNEDLIIALPNANKKTVFIEKSYDGEYYFCIHDVNAPFEAKRKNRSKSPKHITILWDASGSMGKVNHKRELLLLRSYLAKFKNKGTSVDLIFFRNRKIKPKHYIIKKENIEKLIRTIKKVDYDGGTQMAVLSPAKKERSPDFYMLFTDGVSNFGKEEPKRLKAPLYIFSSSSTTNHSFLRYLAHETGGIYFNLRKLDNQTILKSIGSSPFTFISVAAKNGKIFETYPKTAQPVQDRFILVGKLRADKAKVTLNYGVKGEILKKIAVSISKKEASTGNLLRTFWAQKKIEDMQIFLKRNKKEVIKTGKKYGLVTPGTSLIVLDNLEQYLEHQIKPPKSLPKMRKEYEKIIKERKAKEKENKEKKLEYVLQLWKERVEWWEKDFSKPTIKPEVKKREEVERAQPATILSPDATVAAESPADDEIEEMIVVEAGEEPVDAQKITKEPSGPAISLKKWDPNTPYLKKLKKAKQDNVFTTYMEQRKHYGKSPAFFLDCANFFFERKQKKIGLQVLSNIAELELENAVLLRILGHRLAQLELLDLSATVFEEVLQLRPEEPQSYRDLALVLKGLKKYKRAIKLLNHIIMNKWDRFEEIEVVALMELNNIISKSKGVEIDEFDIDPRLVRHLDVGIRIVMTWYADLTDIDLWVMEPSGEKVYYEHKLSKIGGLISRDFTDGYGPEEYVIRKAIPGTYKIKANYYGSSSPELLGPVTLQVDIFTNYGRINENRKSITLRLIEKKEVISVGEIEY